MPRGTRPPSPPWRPRARVNRPGYIGTMKRALLAIASSGIATLSLGQCGQCLVGDTCMVDPPFPTVCPAITPVGVVGVPYDLDVTFWIPPSFPEPTTQLNVVLQQVTLLSLEHVPLGLTYEANSPSLTYYPQVDPFGCVRICGIPLAAVVDTISLTVAAQGTVGGVGITQNYSFGIPIEILPASADSLPDFLFAPDSLCAPMTVAFTDAAGGAPGLTTSYNWTFGNGGTFGGASPPDQTYAVGGSYPVVLQRAFSTPMITQLSITGVSGNWCGDLDEPNLPIVGCVGQPDLYFTLLDARQALWSGPVVNNAQSATWNNLAIPLGFPPFTLNVYDQDEISADDLLGTFTLTDASGSASFSQGGTAGSRLVQVQTVLTITYSDTVTVHETPTVSVAFDPVDGVVCATPGNLASYSWTLNGTPVPNATDSCVQAANGVWQVTASTVHGCTGSASVIVSGVGIPELSGGGPGMMIAPNPAAQELTVFVSGTGAKALYHVSDAQGRIIQSGSAAGEQHRPVKVDLSAIAPGHYVLTILDGGRRASERFVIARP